MMESELHRREALAALLAWYESMGVTSSESESATDWLARGDVAPGADFSLDGEAAATSTAPDAPALPILTPPAAKPAGAVPRAPAAARPERPNPAAQSAAAGANSLDELRAALERFDGCNLKTTAKNLCFYRGAARTRLMLIGEAPGRDEDIEGRPFVGRAGKLLDRMLAAISLSEDDVHITNIVYWRPPGNRTPTPQEALACRPFLERQVELVAPDLVLLLGGAAAKQVLDVPEGIMRLRGKWRDLRIGRRQVRTMATLHPAYLLRTPAAKAMAWRDLLAVRAALDGRAQ
jgi:uracil-DNA glycosylase family 4